jgi:hypothetical protein
MSLEFVKNENHLSLTASVGRDDIWYTIDYPTSVTSEGAPTIELKWGATRHKLLPIPTETLGTFDPPSVKLGAFDSFEEAKTACDEDLASYPPPKKKKK